MMKYYKIMFTMMIFMGTLITISSYTWLGMWMGLEINLLSMIPLLSKINGPSPSEAALKYFVIQVIASLILLFSIVTLTNLENAHPLFNKTLLILYSAIFLKMAAAPFHNWLPEIIEGMTWPNCILMLTWQKIAPFIILDNFYQMSPLMYIVTISSALTGGIMGINQVSLRKIMAYSSINHIAWMNSSLMSMKPLWIFYFTIYALLTTGLILLLNLNKIFHLKDMISMSPKLKHLNVVISMSFLSSAGIPPFLGFLPKWMIIYHLNQMENYSLSLILVSTTLIPMFFYLRISFSALLLNSKISTPHNAPKPNTLMYSMNFISLSGLGMSTLILNWT
uniref:NADH-ubiquinone oxidoreductase chain 2 n=1 Tax=Oomorphoides metallicus TaxID=2576292 RepID=A0A4P8DP79_9CUCU|nr:NADH dehydrogenase subunit 2 [Oomorphoides metallicus]QCL18070.1 NADH dehydrogenase subunit 2 [Oomorphoides metallicus]